MFSFWRGLIHGAVLGASGLLHVSWDLRVLGLRLYVRLA